MSSEPEGHEMKFDAAKTARLSRATKAALEAKQERFIFDGVELLTVYACYLVEHLSREIERALEREGNGQG